MRKRKPSILLIGAHPDDITYAAGGLAALATLLGFDVIEVVATNGQAGSQDEELWPESDIGDIRQQEQLDANAILGISRTIFLNHQDGQLHKAERLTAKLRRLIKRFRPALVVTYGPDGLTGHDDHREISRTATQAFHEANPANSRLWYIAAPREWHEHIRPLLEVADAMYGAEFPHTHEPHELMVLDLSDIAEVLTLKLNAVYAHASQSGPLHTALEAFGGLEALVKHWFAQEAYRLAA